MKDFFLRRGGNHKQHWWWNLLHCTADWSSAGRFRLLNPAAIHFQSATREKPIYILEDDINTDQLSVSDDSDSDDCVVPNKFNQFNANYSCGVLLLEMW